ncbi:MAG: hypothetical protein K1X47_05060 [Cyclobacteriaceae bacterium]|nr:hypothetical protein [Cyclobacteriaceae bacterium]
MIQPKLIASTQSQRQDSYFRHFQQALQNLSMVEKELRLQKHPRLKAGVRHSI